ncbi:MAG: hypothetical protein Q8O07_04645 [Chloroflexota bacterium]|nr:hypothetical protein [Chloroflexota bacterium]
MDTLWTILLQALAPNPVDVAAGSPLFLAFMFVVTLGGIFLVSMFAGVVVNPRKSAPLTFSAADKIIILAED